MKQKALKKGPNFQNLMDFSEPFPFNVQNQLSWPSVDLS